MTRNIALLTDFGLDDYYVGVMKAVVTTINQSVHFIDITHSVHSYNIIQGAFILRHCYKFFPKKTIFLVVIDPGVGSVRRAVALQTQNYYFVGPDNGVLFSAASEDKVIRAVNLTNVQYQLPCQENTFHGRDIFGPAAGYISKGIFIEELGEAVAPSSLIPCELPLAQTKDNRIIGEVIAIDKFGNLVTSISRKVFEQIIGTDQFCAYIQNQPIRHFWHCYQEAEDNEPFLVVGSYGLIEVSLKQQSACLFFNAALRQQVIIERLV